MSDRSAPNPATHEPFTLPGTRPLGCLLVHGFTATPAEVRPLGEALAARGFPVHAVRLAGHGTDVADLAGVSWHDWSASVERGLETLAATVPRVAVAGMSLGAVLALHLAATRPADVAALVLCGTALHLRPPWFRWLPLLARLPFVASRWATIPKVGRDVADPIARAASWTYASMPLTAVVELVRLQAVVEEALPRVIQPTLVLHGRHDHTAPVENVGLLERHLGSAHVETQVLERSWHVITIDRERDRVGELAGDFLARVEAGVEG